MLVSILQSCRSFFKCKTHIVKQNKLVRPATIEVANSVENAIPDQSRQELLNEERQKTTRDDGQVQVVDFERAVQLEGSAVPHDLAATQNDDVVRDERDDGLLVCGHDRLAGDEVELLARVAEHLLPGGGEDGP